MFNSQNIKNNLVFSIYNDTKTVYRLNDIALLLGQTDFQSLSKRLNYMVHSGKLLNLRKGIYAKPGYSAEELAGRIFIPSYISLEYVLQKAGIVFQYNSQISSVSYLSRTVVIDGVNYNFRKIKGNILFNTLGIIQNKNHVNIATPERAFLDVLYLNGNYYFDNLNPLNKDLISELLVIYKLKVLDKRVSKIL